MMPCMQQELKAVVKNRQPEKPGEPIRGKLTLNEPLATYTTWRVGGAAEKFFEPADLADLQQFLRQLPSEESVFWFGLGSNLLVRDGGIKGTVIHTAGRLNDLRLIADGQVYAQAGVYCAKVARLSVRSNLTGVEFLAGIPGTLGGALAMNAGAFGGETWTHVVAVDTLDRSGVLRRREKSQFKLGYRSVGGVPDEWFVAAYLHPPAGDGKLAEKKIRQLLRQRAQTQPTQQFNAGSVFRNPPGDHAARLIEACGLKAYRLGGAEVSSKHANFIVNTGAATAWEIEQLIVHVQHRVFEKCGVLLEPEVHIVGRTLASTTTRGESS